MFLRMWQAARHRYTRTLAGRWIVPATLFATDHTNAERSDRNGSPYFLKKRRDLRHDVLNTSVVHVDDHGRPIQYRTNGHFFPFMV
jgi:hypothetical protein